VAIAGATTPVGLSLRAWLAARGHPVIALSRQPPEDEGAGLWRRCDLFVAAEVQDALEGVDVVLDLASASVPSGRLTQACVEDLDLIIADNLGRAARAHGVSALVLADATGLDGRGRPRDHARLDELIAALTLPTGPPRRPVPLHPTASHAAQASAILDAAGLSASSDPHFPSLTPAPRRAAWQGRSTVRSVQRLPTPTGLGAAEVASAYLEWLGRAFWPLLRVTQAADDATIAIAGLGLTVLSFTARSHGGEAGLVCFGITGGVAVRSGEPPGQLEFRLTPDGRSVVIAIHDFVPGLPWWLYRVTQAPVHLQVMSAFGRYLTRAQRA